MKVICTLQKSRPTLSYLSGCEGSKIQGQQGRGSLDMAAHILTGSNTEGEGRTTCHCSFSPESSEVCALGWNTRLQPIW